MSKAISYLCDVCADKLKVTGIDAVNEVGRKYCECCGNNEDNLIVVNKRDCDKLIAKWNERHG